MTNQEVLAMQKGLNAKGYRGKDGKKLTEDGLLGSNTVYALQTMLNREKGQNLTVDGIWGPATQAAYDNRVSVSSGKSTGTASKTGSTGSSSSAAKKTPTPVNPSPYPSIPLVTLPTNGNLSPYQIYEKQQFDNLTAKVMAQAPKTPAKPSAASSVVFDKKGDINNAKANAKSWQMLLNQQGYRDQYGNKLAEDGIWGPKTEYAWRSYQLDQAKKAATTGGANYTQTQIKEGVAAIANNQLSKALPTLPAAPGLSSSRLMILF